MTSSTWGTSTALAGSFARWVPIWYAWVPIKARRDDGVPTNHVPLHLANLVERLPDRLRYVLENAQDTGDSKQGFAPPLHVVTSWSNDAPPSELRVLTESTVVVGSGYIYVLWVDFTTSPQKIYEARSPSTGTLAGTWSIDSSGPTGYFFVDDSDQLNGKLRGMTVPMVRFNWPVTKISVVWHEKESSGSHLADVYYAAKGSGGWQSKTKISDNGCMTHTANSCRRSILIRAATCW